jgi:integrase
VEIKSYQANGQDYFLARYRVHGKYKAVRADDQGKRFRSAKKAEQFAVRQRELDKVDPVRVLNEHMTVTEWADRWAASRTHVSTSRRWVDGMIRNHIEPTHLGRMQLTNVRETDVLTWMNSRSKFFGGTLANSTLKQVVGLLRAMFATAVRERKVEAPGPVPPNKTITWPRDGEMVVKADDDDDDEATYVQVDADDVLALAEHFPSRYRAMPLVQAGLGLRIGELLALREDDLCFTGCRLEADPHVHVRYQYNDTDKQNGDGPGGRSLPKSKHSVRRVPLPDEVAEVLREHMASIPPSEEDGSLFIKPMTRRRDAGRPISHQHYGQKLLKDAARAIGLPAEFSSHDLRHHYATELISAGVDEREVARYLGHRDAELVLRTYNRLKKGNESAVSVRNAIGASWQKAAAKRNRRLRAV